MEIRGGNGYIEDWVDPRLLRDAHLGSIWEGSSNVIALDVLRCLRRNRAHHTLADTYGTRLYGGQYGTHHSRRWEELRARGDRLLELDEDAQQMRIGRYADDLTRAVMASLLLEQAAFEADRTGDGRKLLVAHTYRLLLDEPDAVPRLALDHLAELAEGGPVPMSVAKEAADA
jgi:hypothetical protein